MSWQAYIDDQLLATGFMYANISGLAGDGWASSTGFTVSTDEVLILNTALSSESNTGVNELAASGFTVAGQRYTFTRGDVEDDDALPYLHGRCKDEGKSSQGVIVVKTNQAVVIGVHDPTYSNGNSFGNANLAIIKLGDYMSDLGF